MSRGKTYGIGVNDSEYKVRTTETVDGKQIITWECPIFTTWKDMMKRCYSENYHKKQPTYKDCSVCTEWLSYMNFHKWAKDKHGLDPDGKKLQLDKDLLIPENIVYSPDTCLFVPSKVNTFLSEGSRTRDRKLPKGLCWSKAREILQVFCKDPLDRHSKFLGDVSSVEEGVELYKKTKLKYLEDLYTAGYVDSNLLYVLQERIKHNE
ncbi:hypothetical protein NVP1161O_215 [Vibrio phage 1.161.O._10N.261.48.C5]|nr:hypothetical protein NVP1161O_215 [Vibrio phage 1.161.O._10N.261.48.C5]